MFFLRTAGPHPEALRGMGASTAKNICGPKIMKLKFLIILFLIFFTVIFFNGLRLAYLEKQPSAQKPSPAPFLPQASIRTTDNAQDFEIYTNPDDGYSLSYPKGWTAETKENTLDISHSTLEGTIDISLQKVANSGSLSPRQFAISENISGESSRQKDEIINIQGVEGYKLIDENSSIIYLPLYGNILKISGSFKGRNSEILKKNFDQIISSFRLLEKSELKSLTGWKTYTNKAMQISFSYPPDFIPNTTDYTSERKILYLKKIEAPDPFYQIEIELEDNFEKSSSEKLASEEVDKYPTIKKKIAQELIKAGGLDAIKIVGLPGKFQKIDVFVGVEDRKYVISLNPYDPTLFPKFYPEATNIFYQFLSSLKFTI